MTSKDNKLVLRVFGLLRLLLPAEAAYTRDNLLQNSPVTLFVTHYLAWEPGTDVSTSELWEFFSEIVAAGELEPSSKQAFLRALPSAMEARYGAKKCHTIKRDGHCVRGFKEIGLREAAG
jgi:hypothetical protein